LYTESPVFEPAGDAGADTAITALKETERSVGSLAGHGDAARVHDSLGAYVVNRFHAIYEAPTLYRTGE